MVALPGRAALTGATKRMRSRSPDKAIRRYPGKLLVITVKPAFSIWPASPVALRLPGLQGECNRVARIRRYAAIRDSFPGSAALTGATGRVRSRSPDKAVRRYPGQLPPVALRLPGLRGKCDRVARIRRYAAIRDSFPGRAALTGATKRMRSRSPDKAVRRYPGKLPPVALRLPGLQGECNRVARIRRYAAIRESPW